MWSRQLLRRIEDPMKKFSMNKSIMNTKESKRIIKTYNRVAKALIEFETLWYQAWVRSIDTSKAGLQATLIVRHPESGKLLVNFDKEIMQLMRETKYLQRMGVEVPEGARMVLLQEDKFKYYFNQLTHILKEHERVMTQVRPYIDKMCVCVCVCVAMGCIFLHGGCGIVVGVACGEAAAEAALGGPREEDCAGDVYPDVDVDEHRWLPAPAESGAGADGGAGGEDQRLGDESSGGQSESTQSHHHGEPPQRPLLHLRRVYSEPEQVYHGHGPPDGDP
jgi:hypothetical protein